MPQAAFGPAGSAALQHGDASDPRYPSPRKLRRVIGFIIDWLIHAGCGVAVAAAAGSALSKASLPGVWVAAWLAASFAHRILIQAAYGTTLGKALTGLCLIRRQDGGRPGAGQLARSWLASLWFSFLLIIELVGSGSSGFDVNEDKTFLPAVRRRDVRALRAGGS